MAENFIQAVVNANIHHEYSDAAGHVMLNIGINEASNEETSSNLLTKADENLYAAKEQGRNYFVCYSISS